MADERSFKLKIISPDRIFYEGEAIMLELNTTEGQIGVYKNHVPCPQNVSNIRLAAAGTPGTAFPTV